MSRPRQQFRRRSCCSERDPSQGRAPASPMPLAVKHLRRECHCSDAANAWSPCEPMVQPFTARPAAREASAGGQTLGLRYDNPPRRVLQNPSAIGPLAKARARPPSNKMPCY